MHVKITRAFFYALNNVCYNNGCYITGVILCVDRYIPRNPTFMYI